MRKNNNNNNNQKFLALPLGVWKNEFSVGKPFCSGAGEKETQTLTGSGKSFDFAVAKRGENFWRLAFEQSVEKKFLNFGAKCREIREMLSREATNTYLVPRTRKDISHGNSPSRRPTASQIFSYDLPVLPILSFVVFST